MHYFTDMFFWVLDIVLLTSAMLVLVMLYRGSVGYSIKAADETNKKVLVYEDRSNVDTDGYDKRTVKIAATSIAADVINTDRNITVTIWNSNGLSSTLSNDERSELTNNGDLSVVLNRVNLSMEYIKTYHYSQSGVLTAVEYEIS